MEKLFFIRIGGTAMGGAAAACKRLGLDVSGSEADLYEPMKSYLAEHGVRVYPSFDPQNLLAASPDKVVVGNAVSRGNEELEAALDAKMELVSLPALIREKLIAKNTSVVIAGTHGKTTTTAMTAWLLEAAGREPGFLIGGVPGNFTESCRPAPPHRHNTSEGVFVIEGDEYDTAYFDKRSKFLLYQPDIAVLNNIEFDHADIFDSLDAVLRSFRLFLRLVPRRGVAIVNGDDENVRGLLKDAVSPVETFGFGDGCDWQAVDLEDGPDGVAFTLRFRGEDRARLSCVLQGRHNAANLLAACAVAHHCGVPFDQMVKGAASFLPPKRRLEEIGTFQGATVVDDFAHHPTAIRATLQALAARYPDRKIWVAFEPRSNTTTRNLFQAELESCFEGAAGVVLGALDRPWRYTDNEKLDVGRVLAAVRAQGGQAAAVSEDDARQKDWGKVAFDALRAWVGPGDVVAVLSNGDFGGLRKMLVGPQTDG